MTIQKTLILLIENIHTTLDELYYGCNYPHTDAASNINTRHLNDFQLGQAYAYVECLEILQLCEQLCSLDLDYEIEARYPLT